jgi:crossover junction endodeoxyribonuclease RuvC
MTRILGLDPGLRHTGWGVIEIHGTNLKHIAHGAISAKTDLPLGERLSFIHHHVLKIVDEYLPMEVAIEEVFVNKNPASTLKLGMARGAAFLAPASRDLPIAEYATNRVKKAIVGAGHADKDQVAIMVRMLLPTCGIVEADAADALAVAICHAHYRQTNALWTDK